MLSARPWLVFSTICLLTIFAIIVALPSDLPIALTIVGKEISFNLGFKRDSLQLANRQITLPANELRKGLDIQGGLQVSLEADMSGVAQAERAETLSQINQVITKRLDLYGLDEAHIFSSQFGDAYRVIVEIPGIRNPDETIQLIGQTAKLDFRLEKPSSSSSSVIQGIGPNINLQDFVTTGLTGQQVIASQVTTDSETQTPQIAIQFDPEGTELFSQITTQNPGKRLGIFIDDAPIALPIIQEPITTGQAVISGGFSEDQAQQLSVQLTAGWLPVPLEVVEQRVIGASLGEDTIQATLAAGLIGLALVMVFMMLNYGFKGIISIMALALFGIYTIAVYKLLTVSLTVPGIAGLLLSMGMAVDSTILIFERLKEELRLGRPYNLAMERAFGRAWNSIKDANIVTVSIALLLINPLNWGFLNTSGLVRSFGSTLLIGILVSLFTGIVVTRNFMRLFLQAEVKEKNV